MPSSIELRLFGPDRAGRGKAVVSLNRNVILLTDDQRRQSESALRIGHDLAAEAGHELPAFDIDENAPAPLQPFIDDGSSTFVDEQSAGCRRRGDRNNNLGIFGADLDNCPELSIGGFGVDDQRVEISFGMEASKSIGRHRNRYGHRVLGKDFNPRSGDPLAVAA